MKRILTTIFASILFITIFGQNDPVSQSDTLRKDAINIYMEASEYLKKEIPYINYVRDRKVADVVIISTSQRTGSGGHEYTYFLEGQGRFSGAVDTISYTSSPDDTQDQIREGEVRTLKQGLMRYVVKTPLSKYIDVKFNESISDEVSTDKWRNWVFRTSFNGFTFGEESSSFLDLFGDFSASKVTNDWKMRFNLNYSHNKREYDLGDEYLVTKRINKSAGALVVKSLNDHWSVGGSANILSSIRNNYDVKFSIMPGIEYDLFPYSESTRRQFRLLYSIGFVYNDYIDTTQYNMLEERLLAHSLQAAFEVVQKWGSVEVSLSWNNYIPEWEKNQLSLDGFLNFRIAKGLNVNLGGNYSFIADQIALRKEEITDEDILTGAKEVATSYSYFVSFGVSYTFGSIYNNVVNPRFGSGGGGRTIIIN